MARRYMDGFESTDFNWWNTRTTTAGNFAIANSAANPITGGRHIRLTKTAGGATGGDYLKATIGGGATELLMVPALNSLCSGGNPVCQYPFYIAFNLEITAWGPTSGTNGIILCRFLDDGAGGATGAGVSIQGTTSALLIKREFANPSVDVTSYIGSGTALHIEMTVTRTQTIIAVYDLASKALVGSLVYALDLSAGTGVCSIRFGCDAPTGWTPDGASKTCTLDLDDIIVNDSRSTTTADDGTSGNVSGPLGNESIGCTGIFAGVSASGAGTRTEWVPTGLANYQNIDEWPAGAISDVDFNTSTVAADGAGNRLIDSYAITDYAGAKTVRAVAMLMRTTEGLSAGANHGYGLATAPSATQVYANLRCDRNLAPGAGVYSFIGIISMYADDGGFWTNAKFNAIEMFIDRYSPSGTATRAISAMMIQMEEWDPPPAFPDELRTTLLLI